jgi:predicted dehydrogenase/nucleoside-diphosphate-sugar epimerase
MGGELRVAILGGGKMAQKHGTAVRLQPQARLVAVGDPYLSAEDIRERFGADVAAFRDVRELLATARPDIVHIVTPPHTHFELARTCLEQGASVYVEKPFALSGREAAEILDLAESRGLRACAAHQVLFQRAGQLYQTHLPMIGELVHVESYFSFKPVRRRADGGPPLSAVDQLIDILPHPVYLMLSALESRGAPHEVPEVAALEVAAAGEVRAVIRHGRTLATLVVTLRGRPIESYLRVVGVNGSVTADFILGDIVKSFGPGASGPAVVVKPFSQSTQKFWGSFAGLCRMLFKRQKSYPGLGELLGLLYESVRTRGAAPISRQSIMNTVRICEQISQQLHAIDARDEAQAEARLAEKLAQLPPIDPARGIAVVTGGTGFLGRATLDELRSRGWRVRALVRRKPQARAQVPGVDYVECDLGRGVAPELLRDAAVVAHLAAETAGNQAAHERNTVLATRNLLDAMQAAGVRRLINISSVAVLKPGPRLLREDSPLDRGNLSRGPYVWAKAEAEALALERAAQGLEVRTIRLGPLVDFNDFTPPGRLGREVARLFVAMGSRRKPLSVCDVHTAANVIRSYAESFADAPPMVNLLEVPPTTRGDLAERTRRTRPDLKFFWMPFPVLRVLAGLATLLQKALKPGRPALDLYAAFKSENYDAVIAQRVIAAAQVPAARAETAHRSAA